MKIVFRAPRSRYSELVLTSIVVLVLLPIAASTQNAPAPAKASAVYKNLRLLQDLPANEIVPTMQFISASLGVGCNHCHVEGAFDKDDKKPKQTARKMIEMVRGINANSFNGELEVTCNSCHRGAARVVGIPSVGPGAAADEKERAATRASVAQVWQRYLQAVGGADELRKITTRLEKGTATIGGRQFPVEMFSQLPNKRSVLLHLPNGDSITTLETDNGWAADPGRDVRAMTSGEVDAAKLDAALQFPRPLPQWEYELRVLPPEPVSDKLADVLIVRGRQGAIGRLYFDPQSGLLVRTVRYANTPLGKNPVQVDYRDYRDEHGVKVPFSMTISRPGGSYTLQLESVRLNAPISADKFKMPETPNRAEPSTH